MKKSKILLVGVSIFALLLSTSCKKDKPKAVTYDTAQETMTQAVDKTREKYGAMITEETEFLGIEANLSASLTGSISQVISESQIKMNLSAKANAKVQANIYVPALAAPGEVVNQTEALITAHVDEIAMLGVPTLDASYYYVNENIYSLLSVGGVEEKSVTPLTFLDIFTAIMTGTTPELPEIPGSTEVVGENSLELLQLVIEYINSEQTAEELYASIVVLYPDLAEVDDSVKNVVMSGLTYLKTVTMDSLVSAKANSTTLTISLDYKAAVNAINTMLETMKTDAEAIENAEVKALVLSEVNNYLEVVKGLPENVVFEVTLKLDKKDGFIAGVSLKLGVVTNLPAIEGGNPSKLDVTLSADLSFSMKDSKVTIVAPTDLDTYQ